MLDSDDGSRLTIDGQVVIEYDGIHGEGSPQRARIKLAKGRRDIRVDYFQGAHGKGLTLSWSGPNFRRRYLTPRDTQNAKDLNEALNSPLVKDLDAETVAEYRKVKRELEETSRKKPWDEYGLCVSEHGTRAPETFVLLRGSPKPRVKRSSHGFLKSLVVIWRSTNPISGKYQRSSLGLRKLVDVS